MKHITCQKISEKSLRHLLGTGAEVEAIRQLRRPLLSAFDIYKGNVLYGVIEETDAEREEVLRWYHALLAREAWALSEIPTSILPYVGGVL